MSARLLGIAAILCAAVILRSLMLECRRERHILCEELYRFLIHIRTRISCYLEPPSRLHLNFESDALMKCGFLKRLSEGEDACVSLRKSTAREILSKEELDSINEALACVGTGYLDEQIRLLDDKSRAFLLLLEKERESFLRDVKLINTLTASLSIGIAILLL